MTLRELLDAATPGEWEVAKSESDWYGQERQFGAHGGRRPPDRSESCYVGALLARLDRISTQTQDES